MTTPQAAGFGWAEVAAVAGGVIVVLIGIASTLVTILIRKQGSIALEIGHMTKENIQGLHQSIKDVDSSATIKIDRITSEMKDEIKGLYGKIDETSKDLKASFNEVCNDRRSGCQAAVQLHFDSVESRIKNICKTCEETRSRQIKLEERMSKT